jgi:A/G-specific adenine glycosylase
MEGVNPFQILVAEFFLRHTRAVVVKRVYEKFVERYPTPSHVSKADERDLIEIMKPLGIVSRAKEIKQLAELIEKDFGGELPLDREALRMMPGVGEYTASAVRIFAFNEHDILVDTNIMRVISRLFGTKNQVEIEEILKNMSGDANPRKFYYMLIDFGALVCKAINPRHDTCPVKNYCKELSTLR